MPLLFTQKEGSTFALNFMQRHSAIWFKNCIIGFFLIASNLSAEDVVFTGKLVRKYYQNLFPQAVEQGIFGWFLELDPSSKLCLEKKITKLSEDDRRCFAELGFDLSIVQLFLSRVEDKQLCRRLEGKRVEVLGTWPSSPHILRPIPSYQLHLTEMKPIPEDKIHIEASYAKELLHPVFCISFCLGARILLGI